MKTFLKFKTPRTLPTAARGPAWRLDGFSSYFLGNFLKPTNGMKIRKFTITFICNPNSTPKQIFQFQFGSSNNDQIYPNLNAIDQFSYSSAHGTQQFWRATTRNMSDAQLHPPILARSGAPYF